MPPDEDVDGWTEDMIWDELQARLDGPDEFQLKHGHIFSEDGPSIPRLRVPTDAVRQHAPRWRRRAHRATDWGEGPEPRPADVRVIFEGIDTWASTGSRDLLDRCSIGTATLHCNGSDGTEFLVLDDIHAPRATGHTPSNANGNSAQFGAFVSSRHGSAYLAKAHTGLPSP